MSAVTAYMAPEQRGGVMAVAIARRCALQHRELARDHLRFAGVSRRYGCTRVALIYEREAVIELARAADYRVLGARA